MAKQEAVSSNTGFTREQIEERNNVRAADVQDQVKALEESSRVTQATMDLSFDPPGQCGGNH